MASMMARKHWYCVPWMLTVVDTQEGISIYPKVWSRGLCFHDSDWCQDISGCFEILDWYVRYFVLRSHMSYLTAGMRLKVEIKSSRTHGFLEVQNCSFQQPAVV